MTYLLEGLKVVDLASFLAAPGAATLMADYGAEVIKIEPPGGDGYRRLHGNWKTDYNWQLTSRNKLGMSLDITSDEGHEVLMRLLDDTDVLVTNFRNDQLERYGMSYENSSRSVPSPYCCPADWIWKPWAGQKASWVRLDCLVCQDRNHAADEA